MVKIVEWISGHRNRELDDNCEFQGLLSNFSIEVMPRTAAKVADFPAILPLQTRVYVAHIAGTPIENMVSTVSRLSSDGFAVMPHIPARLVQDRRTFADWLQRYRDAGANQALLLAGGVSEPFGEYESSLALLETGFLDKYGFERLHVAGHPEGNRDIDPDGSTTNVMKALLAKQNLSDLTDCDMAIVTQFAFEIEPIAIWEKSLRDAGVTLPIHLGIAGPAKLQSMIKFAIACGVGPSVRVLQRRAKDVTNLVLPYEPTEILRGLQTHLDTEKDSLVSQVHFFPLGGIQRTVDFIQRCAKPDSATEANLG